MCSKCATNWLGGLSSIVHNFFPFLERRKCVIFFSALFFPYYFPYISIVVAIEVLNPPYLPLFSRFLCSKNWWLQSLFYYLFSCRHRSSILSIENHATYLKKKRIPKSTKHFPFLCLVQKCNHNAITNLIFLSSFTIPLHQLLITKVDDPSRQAATIVVSILIKFSMLSSGYGRDHGTQSQRVSQATNDPTAGNGNHGHDGLHSASTCRLGRLPSRAGRWPHCRRAGTPFVQFAVDNRGPAHSAVAYEWR